MARGGGRPRASQSRVGIDLGRIGWGIGRVVRGAPLARPRPQAIGRQARHRLSAYPAFGIPGAGHAACWMRTRAGRRPIWQGYEYFVERLVPAPARATGHVRARDGDLLVCLPAAAHGWAARSRLARRGRPHRAAVGGRPGPSSVSHREPHMQQIPPSHIPPRPSPAPSGPPPGAPPVDPDTDDPDVGLPPAGPQQALVWTPRCAVRRTSAAGGDFPPQAPPEGADIPVMPGPGQEPPPAPPPGSDPATNQDPEQSRLPQERRTAP